MLPACLGTRPYIHALQHQLLPCLFCFLSPILHLCSRIGRDYKNMANISNIVPQMDRRYFMGVSQSFASYRKVTARPYHKRRNGIFFGNLLCSPFLAVPLLPDGRCHQPLSFGNFLTVLWTGQVVFEFCF